jgi:hypothetical protein
MMADCGWLREWIYGKQIDLLWQGRNPETQEPRPMGAIRAARNRGLEDVLAMLDEMERRTSPSATSSKGSTESTSWLSIADQVEVRGQSDSPDHPFKDEWSFQRKMSRGNRVAGRPIAPDQPCFACDVPFAVHAR